MGACAGSTAEPELKVTRGVIATSPLPFVHSRQFVFQKSAAGEKAFGRLSSSVTFIPGRYRCGAVTGGHRLKNLPLVVEKCPGVFPETPAPFQAPPTQIHF
ncbi:unnamed protein product [Pleuronectes platessa]|uniref:Uncharacterized protein n=1 Tax=Pleuronectes platessa TaxID=8262 RepID=A0A9N7YJ87_PLEPL|nr:unnamed protein product [Pleuronectes platessa]